MRILKRRRWGDSPLAWKHRILWPAIYGYAFLLLIILGFVI